MIEQSSSSHAQHHTPVTYINDGLQEQGFESIGLPSPSPRERRTCDMDEGYSYNILVLQYSTV